MTFTAEAGRRRVALCSLAVALCSASSANAQTAKAPTVDELVARHIEARGGSAKLKSMQSLRTVGTLSLGSRGDATLTREIKRPNMVRTDLAFGQVTLVHAYDGKEGWEIGPDGKVAPLTGDDLVNAQQDADIEGPLVDYKKKGNKVEYEGQTSVGESRCYNLKVTYPNGDITSECLDTKTYLVIASRVERHGKVQVEAFLSNYRTYDGIQFAGASDIKQAGNDDMIHYKLEKVEINPPIDNTRFQQPPPQEPQ